MTDDLDPLDDYLTAFATRDPGGKPVAYDPVHDIWTDAHGNVVPEEREPVRLKAWLSTHSRFDLWLTHHGVSDGAWRLLFGSLFWILNNNREDWVPHAALDQIKPTWTTAEIDELCHLGLYTTEQPGGVSTLRYWLVRPFTESWRFRREPASRPPIPPELRAAVYERDGHACLICKTPENLTLDHIWPFSRGGEDTFENLQTLCRSCNARKGAKV